MFFVYIIQSIKNNSFYTGMTNNIDERISQHNLGKSNYTKKYMPWVLVYSEIQENRINARIREKYLKTTNGKKKF